MAKSTLSSKPVMSPLEPELKRGKKKTLSQEELQLLNQGLDRLILALDHAIEEARLTTQALKGAGGTA